MNASTCFFTIASKNYLSQVRVLLSSVKRHHPEAATFLVLCDRPDGCFDTAGESFDTIAAEELGIERWPEFAFKYSCVELNTAVKPFAIRRLLGKHGYEQVIYLDPDIMVYRRLDELFRLLAEREVVLTPHLTDFLPDDGCLPSTAQILQTGTNNLGFVAMRRTERVGQLLDWWSRQLYDRCRCAIQEGLFVDQKWMDLVLPCVESAALLRHPGYNAAYWNLPQREISGGGRGPCLVNGEPLAFFHFSGFNPTAPTVISKYQTRLSWKGLSPAARTLFNDYGKRLLAHGYRETSGWPYAYGTFGNGVRIPDCFRRYFHEHLVGALAPDLELFDVPAHRPSLYRLLQSSAAIAPLTGAALALYRCHADLQSAFSRIPGPDALRYAHWFVNPAGGGARLEDVFVEPVRRLLSTAGDAALPGAGLRWVARATGRVLNLVRRQRRLVGCFSPRFRGKVRAVLENLAQAAPRPQPTAVQPAPVVEQKSVTTKVNVFGLLGEPTGLGEAARGMVACFEHLHVPVKKIDIGERNLWFGSPLGAHQRPDPTCAVNYCHLNADCTDALRQTFGREPFAGRFNIGFWAWELEDFPARWDEAFGLYDEIWVPTAFVQQSVAARARIPVVRVPHCIRIGDFVRRGRSAFGLPADRPAILCMFDTGSFADRKNPLGAIRAVERACQSGCDPLLVIKVGRPELHDRLVETLRSEAKHIDCHIIEGWLGRDETLSLIEACDLFISLHRSEGFGLILAEAMALGKPVVATGYSGNLDFMNGMNSFLVDYQLTTLQQDVGPYGAGSRWAEPDLEHAAALIRAVLDNPQRARQIGRRAAADIAQTLSVEAVARQVRQRLECVGFACPAPTPAENAAVENVEATVYQPQHTPQPARRLMPKAA
ncbi:MAG: glycosyltransferase [Thermoguttaceae bacterium]|jgi:glycosyltransferase involved in cell wall biosynthesis